MPETLHLIFVVLYKIKVINNEANNYSHPFFYII